MFLMNHQRFAMVNTKLFALHERKGPVRCQYQSNQNKSIWTSKTTKIIFYVQKLYCEKDTPKPGCFPSWSYKGYLWLVWVHHVVPESLEIFMLIKSPPYKDAQIVVELWRSASKFLSNPWKKSRKFLIRQRGLYKRSFRQAARLQCLLGRLLAVI